MHKVFCSVHINYITFTKQKLLSYLNKVFLLNIQNDNILFCAVLGRFK